MRTKNYRIDLSPFIFLQINHVLYLDKILSSTCNSKHPFEGKEKVVDQIQICKHDKQSKIKWTDMFRKPSKYAQKKGSMEIYELIKLNIARNVFYYVYPSLNIWIWLP